MKRSNSVRRGFTLIELLVVVLIIGILAAVALPQYQTAVEKARFVQAMASMDVLHKAADVYYLEHGEYPSSSEQLNVDPNLPEGYSVVYYHTAPSFALDMFVYRNGRIVLEYVHYLLRNGKPVRSKGKECRVWNDKPVYHKVCQAVSGKSTGTKTSYYTAYSF